MTVELKEKLSSIVRSQLPEFIQADYEKFLLFIEAYYKFLEQDKGAYELIQNARSYNDIDKTSESFVKYFLAQFAKDIPQDITADKRLLIKKIKDLYESKGSEISFNILFNLLFNSEVEIKYPYEFVLRASDGRWQQKYSIKVETVSGDKNDILFRFLDYNYNGVKYSTPITEVIFLSETITEVFLNPAFLPPAYVLGETVTVSDATSVVFTGTVSPTTVTSTVVTGGSGFRRGQVYTINYLDGVGTIIKISNVSSNGAVQDVQFLNYGYGFDASQSTIFSIDLDPTKTVSGTFNVDQITSSTKGFKSEVTIVHVDADSPDLYFGEDYLSSIDYTSSLVYNSSFNTFVEPEDIKTKPENFATITFSLGSIGKYPGAFVTNNGFLSEPDVRLQDALLYQPFAYQTNTGLDIETFYDIVKQTIHPAGQNLFNNRVITSDVDISATFAIDFSSNVFFEALSVINDPSDQFGYTLSRTLPLDTTSTSDTQVVQPQINKLDAIEAVVDNTAFQLSIVINDSVTMTDNVFVDVNTYFDFVSAPDNTSIQASLSINNLENLAIINDEIVSLLKGTDDYVIDYFAEIYSIEPTP